MNRLALLMTLPVLLSFQEVDVSMCGGKPGILESLFTDAKELRIKCINDAYAANQRRVQAEVAELDKLQERLKRELEKTAYTYSLTMVRCHPGPGQPANAERTRKCQEINGARNAVLTRMDQLMGWNERPLPAQREQTTNEQITPPCPPKEDLARLQVARAFNRKVYETWERCVTLQPENFYN